jgi:hypothetical protein
MDTKFLRASSKFAVALAAAVLAIGAWAQPSLAQKATAQVGQAASAAAEIVDVSRQPVLTPQEITNLRAAPRPQNGLTDAQWIALKQRAASFRVVTKSSVANALVPAAPKDGADTPGNGHVFNGLREGCSSLTPSDMGLAVGPKQVLQAVNACVKVYKKTGALVVGPISLNSFFGLPSGDFTFDPRATYDWVSGRFIVVATTIDTNNNAFIDVAASTTGNAAGTYYTYHLFKRTDGGFWDFPTLGQNWTRDKFTGGIYTCMNNFDSNNAFVDARCLFLPKIPIYHGQGFTFNFVFGFYAGVYLDTIQPVNVAEKGEKPRAEFAINSFNINSGGGQCSSGCNGLVVWAFANTLVQSGSPGPVVSGLVISTPSSYNLSANADNDGFCTNCIETLDTRISGMIHYSANSMYAELDTGNGGTSAALVEGVRAFLNDNGDGHCTGTFLNACPTLSGATVFREFCYDCGAGHTAGAYMGDVALTEENNWTMVANFSNGSSSPGTFLTSGRVTFLGLHDGGYFIAQNNNSYTQGRWGDYTAAAPDFAGPLPAVWGSGMYLPSSNAWGTVIGSNAYKFVTEP